KLYIQNQYFWFWVASGIHGTLLGLISGRTSPLLMSFQSFLPNHDTLFSGNDRVFAYGISRGCGVKDQYYPNDKGSANHYWKCDVRCGYESKNKNYLGLSTDITRGLDMTTL